MSFQSDLKKVLILGSGPIQIGQGCEFDYSGTQACKALNDAGIETILVNSNPATIMTDPDIADQVYIEPLQPEYVQAIIERERPDGILPTMGGQVALNLFMELHARGILDEFGVRTLGVKPETVDMAEDRQRFKTLVTGLGYKVVRGDTVTSLAQGLALADKLQYPLIVRASFTLGGGGGGIAHHRSELIDIVQGALGASIQGEVAIEESIIGWKEYELEVMRDHAGNFAVICGIENINPMGVHTGDSITVAPCMTLTDREYQELRNIARHIFSAIGMEVGGANIQFAVHPQTGDIVVVEMNPRVSRSSALVSKATGYPIARISAFLAIGRTLAELENEITGCSPAAFEPAIDYVAIKIPRWHFEKFQGADPKLGIAMKSVGEVLAFGSNFCDAFQKAWRSLELGYEGWPNLEELSEDHSELTSILQEPTERLFPAIKSAFQAGWSVDQLHQLTGINRWFLFHLEQIIQTENRLTSQPIEKGLLREALQQGFTRKTIANLSGLSPQEIEICREQVGLHPTFKMVDTCAAEMNAKTPYYFKTWEFADDNRVSHHKKVVILGSGPNRVGQGIEFDYANVHAVWAAQQLGYEAILVNCNPETVSTDYHVSDKLYVEPLHLEDVLDILRAEQPNAVLFQFGGQTPLKLAQGIEAAGFPLSGCNYNTVALCEDRHQFGEFLDDLGIRAPAWGSAQTKSEAQTVAANLGYPLLLRPSFVIGGQGMRVIREEAELLAAMDQAITQSGRHPVLIDRYLEGAAEFDVDLLCDGEQTFIPTIMQHVEEAGIHSGDSTCVVPPYRLSPTIAAEMIDLSRRIALKLKLQGPVNLQFAVANGRVHVLEVNPRSSRTVPFLAKAVGLPLAFYAAQCSLGVKLEAFDLGQGPLTLGHFAAKAPVFPFKKFPGCLPYTGPDMRSLGEVMGWSEEWAEALLRAYQAAGIKLSENRTALYLGPDTPSQQALSVLCQLAESPAGLAAPLALAERLEHCGVTARTVIDNDQKSKELMAKGQCAFVIDMAPPYLDAHQKSASHPFQQLIHYAGSLGIPVISSPSQLETLSLLVSRRPKQPPCVSPLQAKTRRPDLSATSELIGSATQKLF